MHRGLPEITPAEERRAGVRGRYNDVSVVDAAGRRFEHSNRQTRKQFIQFTSQLFGATSRSVPQIDGGEEIWEICQHSYRMNATLN